MSLLTVAQAVAEEVGLPAPSAIVGSSNKTAKQLYRQINRAGKRLAKRNWSVLQKENTFSTVASTAYYDLPSDYARMLDLTAWDRTSYWQLRGPLGAREWQVKKSALVASATLRSNFRIKPLTRVNKFYVDPTPTSVVSMVFEYASDQWIKNAANDTGKSAYALDTDISIIDEELLELDVIWRFLRRKGFSYDEEYNEADGAIARAFAEDAKPGVLDFGPPVPALAERLNLPEGNFTL